MFKGIFPFLILLFLCTGLMERAQAQQAVFDATTVIIMRHAEKEISKDADPTLSAAGKQRAANLVQMLKDVPVTKLMATPYKRTQQTLAELSSSKGIGVESYDPAQLALLAKSLQETKNQTVVIAGHANTAPDLVNLLINQKKYDQLKEDEFGKVWIITLQSGKAASCLLINTN